MTDRKGDGSSRAARSEEARWVERIAAWDREALAEAYRIHGDHVYGLVFGILRSVGNTEDVVQDIFVALPEMARTFEGRSAFSTWLYRITVRAAMARVHADRRERQLVQELGAWKKSSPPDDPVTRIAVERAYASLRPKYRAVLWLRAREGRSHVEIAEALDISVDLSYQWLHRAREALQKALGEVV